MYGKSRIRLSVLKRNGQIGFLGDDVEYSKIISTVTTSTAYYDLRNQCVEIKFLALSNGERYIVQVTGNDDEMNITIRDDFGEVIWEDEDIDDNDGDYGRRNENHSIEAEFRELK